MSSSTLSPVATARHALDGRLIGRMRRIAVRGLARMYWPQERMFGHCIRRGAGGDALEGVSRRYTAITLIGLAGEVAPVARAVLGEHAIDDVCARLISDVERVENLGDVALTLWAARANEFENARPARERLAGMLLRGGVEATVELAWCVTALTLDGGNSPARLRDETARRLLSAYERSSGLFRHASGGAGPFMRGHVVCFADVVYPVQALSLYHGQTGNAEALEVAAACARKACALMGEAGQWWWHYDVRVGRVVEKYPVYAVHQDAMAPMCLFDLAEAGGPDLSRFVARGLDWLESSPELAGRSLIDDQAGLIWRKVARKEPKKLVRKLQAAATAIHPALGVPAVDSMFPPTAIDWECRPYHLGWLLHAFSPARLERWGMREAIDAAGGAA